MAPPATKVGLLLDPSVWFSSSGLSASSSAASDSESSEVESVSLEDTTVSVELRIATREDAVAWVSWLCVDDPEESWLEASEFSTSDRSFSVVEEAAFSDVCSPFWVCSEVVASLVSPFVSERVDWLESRELVFSDAVGCSADPSDEDTDSVSLESLCSWSFVWEVWPPSVESVLAVLSVWLLLLLDSTLGSELESRVSSVEDAPWDGSERVFAAPSLFSLFLSGEGVESDASAWARSSLLLLTWGSCWSD